MGWQFFADTRGFSKGRLHSVSFKGRPWVVAPRQGGGFNIFEDRCPHRNFPLSKGILKEDGKLLCSYHGWTFDAQGRLIRRPGYIEDKTPEYCLPKLNSVVAGDLLFVCEHQEPVAGALPKWMVDLDDSGWNSFRYVQHINARSISVIENLLDPFHTHFIHQPFLRSDNLRYDVDVEVQFDSSSSVLELTYTGEPTPTGLISKLFEKDRIKTVGRYWGKDGVSVLEYWTSKGLDLRVTLAVSASRDQGTHGALIFQVRKGWMPFWLLRPIYKFMTHFLVRQDFEVLAEQELTWQQFPEKPVMISQQDYVYKVIQKLQAGAVVDDFQMRYRIRI